MTTATSTATFNFLQCRRCKVSRAFPADRNWDCQNCGRMMIWKKVTGTQRDEVKCGGKCLVATGSDCECSCGGEHHGRFALA